MEKLGTRNRRKAQREFTFRNSPCNFTYLFAVLPIFEFISSTIRPNAALIVFPLPDDYSYGILQSEKHWKWFVACCSTLKGDFRYTSNTVFDTFPWPQSPTLKQVKAVAAAAVSLRKLRTNLMQQNNYTLRELYRTLELPGANPLKDAHAELDATVRAVYGVKKNQKPLPFLLELNHQLAKRESQTKPITPPGLPPCVTNPVSLITTDCVALP